MIFFARNWQSLSPQESARGAASLGLFAGHPADSESCGSDFFAELPSPRAKPRRGWRVSRSRGGLAVLLCGWIDNVPELAETLGILNGSTEEIYGAAVERWGDDADRRVIGSYSAIVCLPDGTVRLSRSPWTSTSLFYHKSARRLLACTIPRPLFAAGVPKNLRPEAVDDLLGMTLSEDTHSMFADVESVFHGTVVRIDRAGLRTLCWYDPLAIPTIRFRRDEEYVEAGNALLAEAAAKALNVQGKVGVMLSGGLDSSTVCDELLRQLPVGERLTSFTFHPSKEWDGRVPAHNFGDDKPYVEAFAATHPRLDPIFVDNHGIAFDDRAQQMFTACDAGYPARVLGSVYHGAFDAARENGCDWLFGADFGNMTFSNLAPWAYGEFLRSGKWRQLWQLAASRLNDPRPVWRRVAAHAVMPQFPAALRGRIRNIVHSHDHSRSFANPYLAAEGRLRHLRSNANDTANIMTASREESRESFIAAHYAGVGLGAEVGQGTEQVFGVRLRDVTAYRPLIEFCFGVPTEQYVRNGETRWLARRMAMGRMPDAQRTNRLYGRHNVDWHARLTPRLGELRLKVEALARHPDLGPLIDTDSMLAAINNWPKHTPLNEREAAPLRFFLPAVLYVASYVDQMTGRNAQ